MTLLFRYLTRSNLFLLFIILLAGTGIYVITDLFERIENFIEADIGLGGVFLFFLAKVPNIISQILPAVFLIALIIQLNILARTNEMVALKAGGISPMVILRFIIIYGFAWALMQLLFSQVIGVQTERYASNMWDTQVRGNVRKAEVRGLWFTEKNYIVHLDYASATEKEGKGFIAYELSDDSLKILTIIDAQSFTFKSGEWHLFHGGEAKPEEFIKTSFDEKIVPLKEDLEAFAIVETTTKPEHLPLWELGTVIKKLQTAGSNVENLRVAWHGKISYAFSILVVGIFALAICQTTSNIYKAVASGILVIFIYYTLNTFSSTLGDKGIIPPVLASWSAAFIGTCTALVWLAWPYLQRKNE